MSTSETIHLVFKTHLDIGFTDFAQKVTQTYFDVFIPTAIETARKLREAGKTERFIWTTGSWLIYEYLEQGNPKQRKQLEAAIEAGDIVWHGLPFTTHTELMTVSLFQYGLSLSQQLDKRFGKKTIAAKMTDVPGHTRGIIPLLAEAGIQFIHLGANAASTPPDVPPVFVWWDEASQTSVNVMYQRGGYGGIIRVPNLAHTLAFAHTNDNHGAQSLEEVLKVYQEMRKKFPKAKISASTMDAYAAQLSKVEAELPVITAELGDTWIHGVGTDPLKISRYRELARLREEWIQAGKVEADDPKLAAFTRKLFMVPEHTWGMDEKTHLRDYTHYAKADFEAARKTKIFKNFESSWAEQRAYVDDAVKALGDSPLAKEAKKRLKAVEAKVPNKAEYQPVKKPNKPFQTAHFEIGFDKQTGAISHLVEKATGRNWASAEHMQGLFRYQTFSTRDYDHFWEHYIINKRETRVWSWDDYTKPGMKEGDSESRFWLPTLAGLYTKKDDQGQSFLLELKLAQEASEKYGAPKQVYVDIRLPNDQPIIDIDLQWFEKPANRLPEAVWFTFNPVTRANGEWLMDKMGARVSPLDVIKNGNRKLHAVESGVYYSDKQGKLSIETLDAALVAPGEPSLLNFNNRQPDMKNGIHFNLLNNVWGTNFPMWYDDDTRFRFQLVFG
jgi:hypothetical protein